MDNVGVTPVLFDSGEVRYFTDDVLMPLNPGAWFR